MEKCLQTIDVKLNTTVKSGKNEYTCIKSISGCHGCCFTTFEDDIANCESPYKCDAETREDHTETIYVKS